MPISIREDFLDYPSVLKLALGFLHGRDKLKRLKFREGKKLVSVTFPFSDIIFAADAAPVFPVRMHEFPESSIYRLVDLATATSGWGMFSGILQVAQNLAPAKNFIDGVIVGIIDNLNAKYNELAQVAESAGVSSDFCYGIKGMSGMFLTKGHNIDLNLNWVIRCSSFSKYYEYIGKYITKGKNSWFEVPVFSQSEWEDPDLQEKLVEFTKQELQRVIGDLEDVTGNTITQNKLRETAEMVNECRELIDYFFFEAGKGDKLPCRPHAFSEILILLVYSFIDCCSDLKFFLETLRALKKETQERLQSSKAFDTTGYKKVLYVPVFGGYEAELPTMVYENKGICYFADWHSWDFLTPVETKGDMIENYARSYLRTHSTIGCDWTEMVSAYKRTVDRLQPDGIIFNQVFGCRMMSVGYTEFKNVMNAMDIPVTLVNFNKIGENLGQTRTRVDAFMEML